MHLIALAASTSIYCISNGSTHNVAKIIRDWTMKLLVEDLKDWLLHHSWKELAQKLEKKNPNNPTMCARIVHNHRIVLLCTIFYGRVHSVQL